MEAPFIKSLIMKGFLSYGPNAVEVPLGPLNVLIGPNGSGKSNLVEAISVLRAVPKDLPLPIRKGGSVRDWLWKGTTEANFARLEIIVAKEWVAPGNAVHYRLDFGAEGDSFTVLEERTRKRVQYQNPLQTVFLLRRRERQADDQREQRQARAASRGSQPRPIHFVPAPRPGQLPGNHKACRFAGERPSSSSPPIPMCSSTRSAIRRRASWSAKRTMKERTFGGSNRPLSENPSKTILSAISGPAEISAEQDGSCPPVCRRRRRQQSPSK